MQTLEQIASLHPLDLQAKVASGEVTPLQVWQLRAAGAVSAPRADTDNIAEMCLRAEQAGGNCSVWHQSAIYFGHRCNCAPCNA